MLKSLMKNTAARSFTELLNRFGSVAFWIIVIRALGAEGLGSLSFAISLFSLFLTLSTLGLGAVVIRDVARNRASGGTYLGLMLVLGTGSSILAALLMVLAAMLLQTSAQSVQATLIMAIAMLPSAWFMASRSILTAFEKLEKIAIARTVEFLVKVSLGILLLSKGYGLLTVVAVVALSKIISGIIALFYAVKTVHPSFSWDWKVVHYLGKQIPTFSLITFFNSSFWNLPVIAITYFGGEYQAGLFSAAYKLVDVLLSFTSAYGQALFPVASKTIKTDSAQFSVILKKSIKYIGVISLAIAAGGSMTAEKLIELVYQSNIHQTAGIFRILIWMVLPFSFIPVFAYSLVSSNLQKHDLFANMSASTSLALLLLVLVPMYGAVGGAIALLVGSLVFLVVEVSSVHQKLLRLNFSAVSLKPAFSAILMSLLLYITREWSFFLSVIIGGAFYISLLWASHYLSQYELEAIKSLKREKA